MLDENKIKKLRRAIKESRDAAKLDAGFFTYPEESYKNTVIFTENKDSFDKELVTSAIYCDYDEDWDEFFVKLSDSVTEEQKSKIMSVLSKYFLPIPFSSMYVLRERKKVEKKNNV